MIFFKRVYPMKGWKHLDTIDLANLKNVVRIRHTSLYKETCEFCKSEKMRFAHILTHAKFKNEIKVCLHCAEKLVFDNDFIVIEQMLEEKYIRKIEFIRTGWSKNRNGNLVKQINGNVITIFLNKFDTGFCFVFAGEIYKGYKSVIKAKWAAFDIADEIVPMGVY